MLRYAQQTVEKKLLNPRPERSRRETNEYLFGTFFQESRKIRTEHQREITAAEVLQLGKELEYSYNNAI